MNTRTAVPYPRAPFYLLLLTAVTVFGFWPSYFARLRETDLIHHFHGIVAGAWLLLLVTQAWLMRQRRFALHRALGRTSLVLAPLFVVSGLAIVHAMLTSANPFSARYGAQLAFVDLPTVAWFGTCYVLALRHRRDRALHARWMLSTALLVLPPAIARALPPLVPAIHSFEAAFNASFAIAEAIIVVLIVRDLREDRLRLPYVALLAVMAIEHAGFFACVQWPWWKAFCGWIAAL